MLGHPAGLRTCRPIGFLRDPRGRCRRDGQRCTPGRCKSTRLRQGDRERHVPAPCHRWGRKEPRSDEVTQFPSLPACVLPRMWMQDPVTGTILLGPSRRRSFLAWGSLRTAGTAGGGPRTKGRQAGSDPAAPGTPVAGLVGGSGRTRPALPGCSQSREARGGLAGNSCPRPAAAAAAARLPAPFLPNEPWERAAVALRSPAAPAP